MTRIRLVSIAATVLGFAGTVSIGCSPASTTAMGGSGGAPMSSGGSTSSGGTKADTGAGGSAAGTGGSARGGISGTGGMAGAGSGGTPGASGGTGAAGDGAGGSGPAATGGKTGAQGTGGANVGSACPGVPIVPDAKGLVALGSNPLAIRGSFFEYSDCVDLKNVNCSMVTTPPANSFPNVGGKLCTSGRTSTATGAWGAGIGFELNDGPPQLPYDTTAHGVKGFCFQLSGPTIPSTTLRVAFPTKNNTDNAYFSAVSTTGQHTVLFSDLAQGSWVTTKTPFEPKAVMLLQFQIPASPTAAVPWDFCIEGLTAVTQ